MRYKDSLATSLRERELAVASGGADDFDDDEWDDRQDDMVVRVADYRQYSTNGTTPPSANPSGATTPTTTGPGTPVSPAGAAHSSLDAELERASEPFRTLLCLATYRDPSHVDTDARPKDEAKRVALERRGSGDGGVVLDADREVEIKLLLGKTGSKHGALPAMAALGIVWIVPTFEGVVTGPDSRDKMQTVTIDAVDVDFLKPQAHIKSVEFGFRAVGDSGMRSLPN